MRRIGPDMSLPDRQAHLLIISSIYRALGDKECEISLCGTLGTCTSLHEKVGTGRTFLRTCKSTRLTSSMIDYTPSAYKVN